MKNRTFDGVHLRGVGGGRHFTYRAVQSFKPVLTSLKLKRLAGHAQSHQSQDRSFGRQRPSSNNDNHSDCEKARYNMRKQKKQNKSYAEAATYNIPTSNYYATLNC